MNLRFRTIASGGKKSYVAFMTPATFHMQTFGCQMNAADSEWLARALEARGFVPAPFEEAAFHILNTCSVRDKPEQKVYSELGRIARFAKVAKRKDITVCVGGCVAQQVGAALARRFPQVRLVFGTDGIAGAPDAMERLLREPGLRLSLLDFAQNYIERPDPRLDPGQSSGQSSGPDRHPKSPALAADAAKPCPPALFVNIMQGCDNYCSYCIVPLVRGRQKSRAPEAVLEECRLLLAKGAREITLLGQNVNSYGQDLGPGGLSFPDLLRRVAAISGLERLRFVTSHPKDIAPEVIEAFADLKCLCPRLHLPLQSGSDRILAAMNRRYDARRYLDIVRRLRLARPDIVLTTDIIVGFPGESRDDFQATLDVMEEAGFASAFSFVYSDRPGARACLLPDKVDRALALERLSILQERQNQASENLLASMVGRHDVILVEDKSRMSVPPEQAERAGQAERDAAGAAGGPGPEDPPGPQDPQAPAEGASRGGSMAKGGPEAAGPQERPGLDFWQGRTPQGFIVNVPLGAPPPSLERGWQGALLPVRVESAAKHSLRGSRAGEAW